MDQTPRLEHEIAARVRAADTGALEVSAARRKRRFFLQDGLLVATASNLRAEQGEPDAPAEAAALRLAGALSDPHATWAWYPGAAPPERLPLSVWTLLARALGAARLESELQAALSSPLHRVPTATPAAAALGLDAHEDAFVRALDGSAMASERVASARIGAGPALALLWVLEINGALRWEDAAAPPPAAGDDADDLELDADDIGALIAAEVRATVAPPPAAAQAPGDAPDRLERLAALAVEIEAAPHHFAVLGLPWDAPTDQFRQAYMRLARDLHPDRFSGASAEDQDRAARLFDRIRAAWDLIGDSEARRKYTDTAIHGKKSEEEAAMEEVQRFWTAEGDFRRGLAAFHAGRLKSAHELFKTAHLAFPDELEFKAYHAYTRYAIDGASATADTAARSIAELKDVLERNGRQERKLDAPHVLMGRIHLAQGDLEEARKCFVNAMRLNPANADAQLQMRRVEASLNKPEKKGFFASLFGKKGG